MMKNRYLLEIIRPDEREREKSISIILDSGLGEKKTFYERIKRLLLGPGINILFYQSKLQLWTSVVLYVFIMLFNALLIRISVNPSFFVIMMFPVINVVYFALSEWSDQQSNISELKKTFKYSYSYIISLRMFYVSIFSIIINESILLLYWKADESFKLGALGFGAVFVFSTISLMVYEKSEKCHNIFMLCIIWIVFCLFFSKFCNGLIEIFFQVIPISAYWIFAGVSFLLFFTYLGKVGKENAYAS